MVLQIALKCADIGHAAKEWDLHNEWSNRICKEFFNQGDNERKRGMPISVGMDRFYTVQAKS